MDCARIARSVLDTEITQSDVVVICWTGFDRFNYQYDGKWQGLGSMLGNKDFYTKYYTAEERFATMYDAMTLIDLDSKTRGYQAWHFSAFPWLLGEIEKTPHPENIVRSQSRNLNNLFMHKDLGSYKLGINDSRTSHKYNPHDNHPTPECHWKWLKQVILPEIKIDLDLDDRVKLDQQRVLRGDVN